MEKGITVPSNAAKERMAEPTVSVIVAVRNGASTIRRTLESVLAQTHHGVELIVVDGASTDGTTEVIADFRGCIAGYISEPDNGIADAYNKGIRLAHGQWLYFLNADDIFYKDSTLAEIFQGTEISSQGLVVGKVLIDDSRIVGGRYSWTLLMRNNVHHQAVFYRRQLIQSLQYNTQYRRYGHDHEHNLILWRRRVPVLYVSHIVARWSSGGISNNASWKDYREEFRVRRNVIGPYAWAWNGFTVARYILKRFRRNAGLPDSWRSARSEV